MDDFPDLNDNEKKCWEAARKFISEHAGNFSNNNFMGVATTERVASDALSGEIAHDKYLVCLSRKANHLER